jgi:hypothetical protein
MKHRILLGALSILLIAGVAYAATVFLTVTAPPFTEVAGSAAVDGPTHIYLSILPSAEIHHPTTRVTVYEGNAVIWSGHAFAIHKKLIKTYTADAYRRYTLEIAETDGITVTAKLLYD